MWSQKQQAKAFLLLVDELSLRDHVRSSDI